VAKNEKDLCALIDTGLEYVCDFNEHKIFRKRKYQAPHRPDEPLAVFNVVVRGMGFEPMQPYGNRFPKALPTR